MLNLILYLIFAQKFIILYFMELKEIMKSRRTYLKISQQDLAELSGISLSTIKDIERGKGNPSLSTASQILDVLGMEIEYKVRQTII